MSKSTTVNVLTQIILTYYHHHHLKTEPIDIKFESV